MSALNRTRAPRTPAPDVMSSEQLLDRRYTRYGLFGEFKTLLGDPEIGAAMMLFGQPGHGKSTLALKLGRYFAQYHGNVLYVSSEQYDSASLQEVLRRNGGAVKGLDFSKHIPTADLHRYSVLVVDSVAHCGLTLAQFNTLRQRYPDLAILLIQQVTKTGQYRGTTAWAHEVDISVEVKEGRAQTVKNRYAPLAAIRLFAWATNTDDDDAPAPPKRRPARR